MNKLVLASRVAKQTGLSKARAMSAVEAMIEEIKRGLKEGDDVQLVGFGTFKVVERRARKGRNPKTGERIDVPAKRAVRFSQGKDLKTRINATPAEGSSTPAQSPFSGSESSGEVTTVPDSTPAPGASPGEKPSP